MNYYVTILGSGAALPTAARHCSGQIVNLNGFRILLDCGENTQTQIRVYHQKMQSLSQICITHLHGDHFFGLPGLLSSMHLCNHKTPVDIYAPAGIARAMQTIMEISSSHLDFEVHYHELSHTEGSLLLFENKYCSIRAFPLIHSVPTYGYLIEEKPRGKNPPRRYAYCTDTAYTEAILPYIEGVNLLCLESTFNNAFASIAAEKLHCTASQAATLALKANAKQLLLTHISARYKEPEPLLAEATSIFPNTLIAADGVQVEVHY
ncbi:MAG: ribonuclease Z [Bacteroidales bacterium]|nr:ribonuclease Z [Bacteroidales bacterium]MBR3412004.1 ribonuclease Z [Bacteroidales bacterium]